MSDANAGAANERSDVEQQVRKTLTYYIPEPVQQRAALEFIAFAIENADEERSDAWSVRVTSLGIRVMAGRLLACETRRAKMRVSVIGPISSEVRQAIQADPENDDEFKFKAIPGGVLITFPVGHAAQALPLLKDGLNAFVDLAMARLRRAVDLEDHDPKVVTLIGSFLGRELPQPDPAPPQDESEDDDGEEQTSREPRVRGRAPIFEHGQRSIASLVSDIEREVLALPDLQRPFVWEDTSVRDLLDSLFVGFPVGTLVLWHTSSDKDAKAIAAERPGLRATMLVIDGQQRLTSLYAVIKGVDVVEADGSKRKITIAFRPRDGRFEVLNALKAKGRSIDDPYEDAVERNLERAA